MSNLKENFNNFTGSTILGAGTSGTTGNVSSCSQSPPAYTLWQTILVICICGIIVLGTIIGNILVCTAVGIVRKLRTPSNLLIVSLALADLLVALLVMPLAVLYEVTGRWPLGQQICDMWTSLDVMLCTASILNLCMISVDRYLVITRPFQYALKRTPMRMAAMIVAVWILSALISIPPLFGWKAEAEEGECILSQAIGYQVYATIGAFYLPLTVMIVIYYRIYMVSSRLAHAESRTMHSGERHHSCASVAGSVTPLRKRSSIFQDRIEEENFALNSSDTNNKKSKDGAKNHHQQQQQQHQLGGGLLPPQPKKRFRIFPKSGLNKISSSHERKATKTLGVIMGAFTACWLPFFILALIKPFLGQAVDCIPHWLNSVLLWLGYCNSFLNPIIYARFNRDFRMPFKEILLLRCRGINLKIRTESYAEQYGPCGTSRDNARLSMDNVLNRVHLHGKLNSHPTK